MKKRKRKIPYILLAVLLIAYVAFLSVSSLSSGIIGTKRISFASTSLPVNAEDITVVLQSGETSLLDQFDSLKSADFSGSTNYEEITRWAAEHPEVDVTYTVSMPNGEVLNNDAAVADLYGLEDKDIEQTVQLLKYLPKIESINLGAINLSSSGYKTFTDSVGGIPVDYTVSILGQNLTVDTESINLTGLTSAEADSCADKLLLLPNITSITIGSNATQNGELTWHDIETIAASHPDASLNYEFSVANQKLSLGDEYADFSSISSADVSSIAEVLPSMTRLKSIKLGNITPDEVQLLASATNAAIDYPITIYGVQVNLSDEIWDFNHIPVSDAGQDVARWLPCANNLRYLDMDSCGVSSEDMAKIRDDNPGVEVIWRVNFGSTYSVRTNVTKILASKPSKGGTLYNQDVNNALKYCTRVKYLDLGHNDNLSDFSFVQYMPDLEIAVISMCDVSDLTPFASCPKLIYLEAGNTNVSDLSPLANCKNLKHLNVGTCFSVRDISSLYELDMLRLWLGSGDPVPSEQVAKMKELHPDCEINTTASTGLERDEAGNIVSEGYTAENWKYYQKYLTYDWNYYSANNNTFPAQRPLGYFKVAYKAFRYNLADNAYAFYWNDPKYEAHDASVQPVNTYTIDTSFLTSVWATMDEEELSVVPDVLTDPPGETLVEATY